MKKDAFTTIELLVVLTIIFSLVGISISAYNSWKNRSKIEKAKADIQNIEMACEMYRSDYGEYPQSFNTIITSDARYGKFTSSSFIDPWNNIYEYRVLEDGVAITIRSYGPNGIRGDEDDITNEQL